MLASGQPRLGPKYLSGGTTPRNPTSGKSCSLTFGQLRQDPQYLSGGTTPRNPPMPASPAGGSGWVAGLFLWLARVQPGVYMLGRLAAKCAGALYLSLGRLPIPVSPGLVGVWVPPRVIVDDALVAHGGACRGSGLVRSPCSCYTARCQSRQRAVRLRRTRNT